MLTVCCLANLVEFTNKLRKNRATASMCSSHLASSVDRHSASVLSCDRRLQNPHQRACVAASAHPALQLRGELGLKLAGGPFAVVPLDEHFVGQRRAVPQLLQIVELQDK